MFMSEFFNSLDPTSFIAGMIFAYAMAMVVSLINVIDSHLTINNLMIRLKRAELGLRTPKSPWDWIMDRFCKK